MGPLFLLTSLILLFTRTAPILGRPTWLTAFGITVAIACWIIYLSYCELRSIEKSHDAMQTGKEKEADQMRSLFDEARGIYREKIDKLEEILQEIESEHQSTLLSKEQALEEITEGAQALTEEAAEKRTRASSLQDSLEEALDELRALRQHTYLKDESLKQIPIDLPQQHQQLRGQFEEKSVILDQTRRRLFTIEGHLLSLKKDWGMEKLDESVDQKKLIGLIQSLTEENERLEEEVTSLELLISDFLTKKKKSPSKKKEKLERMLELQF